MSKDKKTKSGYLKDDFVADDDEDDDDAEEEDVGGADDDDDGDEEDENADAAAAEQAGVEDNDVECIDGFELEEETYDYSEDDK